MGEINIKSENQSGGITAHTVNTGESTVTTLHSENLDAVPKESKAKTISYWVFGVGGLIGVILAFFK